MTGKQQAFRHTRTGQRGFLIAGPDGSPYIRVDNDAYEIKQPVSPDWEPEGDLPPVSDKQIRYIAFEADRALCKALGLHRQAQREWINMDDEARIRWNGVGPVGGDKAALSLRKLLYTSIIDELTEALKKE